MAATKSTGKSAQKGTSEGSAADSSAHLQLHLRMVAVELRFALSSIAIAAYALREQNADIDADVAMVLQRGASAPVHTGLDKIEVLLRKLDGPGGVGAEAEEEGVH